ncbi:hypothetical protein [Streptomyces sp. SID9727]|uniref:hypothetical protein n=1 Tax=Streptomyces sp. SID9727 TaxID=2706114 RepID=UPI0013CB0267|nr:hypothetical protein [Streptomyces sp. SID9727]NEC65002.1 hypothetical protein [Streptomyces sp. SID9727]
MRTRTAAASAAVVLLTLLGSTACSASSDGASPSSESGQTARSKPATDPSECAVPTDEMPEECEVHESFAVIEEGVPADGMPTPAPGN